MRTKPLLLAVSCWFAASGIAAQDVEEWTLGPPLAVAATQFTQIVCIRELSDGTTLVADRAEDRVLHIGWAADEGREIGRPGDGPGEYRGVGCLYAMAGDSTLFFSRARWNLLARAEIVETRGEARPFNQIFRNFLGTDRLGRVLGVEPIGRGMWGTADSLALVIGDRSTVSVDTLLILRGAGVEMRYIRPRYERHLVGISQPYASPDQAILFPDGWLAVAHQKPYRVDWRLPDGRWVKGQPLPFEPVPLTEEDKCAVLPEELKEPRCDPSILDDWPEVMPPFPNPFRRVPVLIAGSDGSLLILRTQTNGDGRRSYDVVNRQGSLEGRLVVPAAEYVVGFGTDAIYVVEAGAFDLQILRRHRWPLRDRGS